MYHTYLCTLMCIPEIHGSIHCSCVVILRYRVGSCYLILPTCISWKLFNKHVRKRLMQSHKIINKGPTLCSTWVLLHVLAASLLIQLLGKSGNRWAKCLAPHHPHGHLCEVPGLVWSSPGSHQLREPVEGRFLPPSLWLSLSVTK